MKKYLCLEGEVISLGFHSQVIVEMDSIESDYTLNHFHLLQIVFLRASMYFIRARMHHLAYITRFRLGFND